MAGLVSLAGALTGASSGFLQEEGAFCYLIAIDDTGSPNTKLSRSFQFWPATISDNEQVNYAAKQIPGGNLPFYQWVSGGEHVVAFEAVFARDIWAPELGGLVYEEDKHNVDVAAAVMWLRTLKRPAYLEGEDFARPPSLLYLVVPNTPIGRNMSDRMLCIMTQCDINYQKWFPDGTIRLAKVSLSFAETVQMPGNTKFYGIEEASAWSSRYTFTKGIKYA